MPHPRAPFLRTHRRTLLGLIFGLGFSAAIAYAVPPTSFYQPGATLDPTCTPGDTNCSVLIPQTQWSDVTGGINYASNVGINTPSPSALLHITGQNPNNYAQLLGGDSSNTYNNFVVRLEDNGPDNYGLTTINMSPEEGISLYAQRGVYYTNFHTNPYSSSISNQYGTQFAIEDTGNYSLVKLGDVNWNGNGSRLVINDIDKTINLGLSESSAADGIEGIQIQLDSTNHPTVKVGSTAFYGNGTNLTVDDASATISLNSGCTYFGRNYIGTVYMSDDCYGGDIGLRNGLNDESIAVYYPSTNSYRYGGDSLYVYSDSDGGFGGDTVNGINLNKQFSYINFNADAVAAIGSAGYGFRDNAGVMEFKNNGGSWGGFGGGDTLQQVTDLGNVTSNEIFVNNIANVDMLRLNPLDQVSAIDLRAGDDDFMSISSSTGTFNFNLGTNGVSLLTNGSSFMTFDKVLNSNFLGLSAGQSTPTYSSPSNANFFGYLSGQAATSASFSNFLGYRAGNSATFASNSNFFGQQAGQNATNASFSNFLGSNAGNSATNAANSIFIGQSAGQNDTVDNTTNGLSSILIGSFINTGGFSNSILLGSGDSGVPIANTKANQFMLADSITEARWRSIDYTFPASQAASAGYVLMNNGSGTLSWGAQSGGGGAIALFTDGTANGSQTALNLTSGSNISLSDDGAGTVTINSFISSPITIANSSSLFSTGLLSTGSGSTAIRSIFLGQQAGRNATNASYSNFFGSYAGFGATNAADSNFFGQNAGRSAANANNSNFIGTLAGNGATNAANSTFIGLLAGSSDTVDNTANGLSSILIGSYINTGGFSNSILLGSGVSGVPIANTKANQFMLADSITEARLGGIEYTFPASQAGAPGDVLTNDGSGVLSWATGGGGGSSPITIQNSNSLFSTGLSGTGSGSSADQSIFLGLNSGNNATNAHNSNFLGDSSGAGATNADSSNFLGAGAGQNATNAQSSNFFGVAAGQNAINAANSIFIGGRSGFSDTVNNTAVYNDTTTFANTSILLGHKTSTAGFSNSIAIGAYATNTATNQFMIGSTTRPINQVVINGSSPYLNFGTTGGTSGYGIRDNAGVVEYKNSGGSWAGFGGSSSPITIVNTSSLSSTGLTGTGTGSTATNSIFLGTNAGNSATSAYSSNFFGPNAGQNATSASNSNFFGNSAGYQATNASKSNFIGQNAGRSDALNSLGTINAANSIFLGTNAGFFAADFGLDNTTNADDYSILIGNNTSTGGFENSIALGANATNTASNQFMIGSTNRPINEVLINGSSPYLNFGTVGGISGYSGYGFRDNAGIVEYKSSGGSWARITSSPITTSGSSLFSTGLAGAGSGSSASNAIFLGTNAGNTATNADFSNFFGLNAGNAATNANTSNFFGLNAGNTATNASTSNFIGYYTGYNATNAANSNFIGIQAGYNATNARNSNFIGQNAGNTATSAANSIFIGTNSGISDTVNNTAAYNDTSTFANTSILLGHLTSTGGFSNSIAIGAYATNTATNQFMIGSANRPINSTRINGSSSTQCTITTGTGIACTSDERLKTNVVDLPSSTLESLLSVKTVTYNWSAQPDGTPMIGFLAQDLEQYFPQLVSTDTDGYKSVYYAQMTPILVEAIREMNTKILSIQSLVDGTEEAPNFSDNLRAWLANAGNRITRIFTGEVCLTDPDGTSECLNKSELTQLKQLLNQPTQVPTPTEQTPESIVEVPTDTTQQPPEVSSEEPLVIDEGTSAVEEAPVETVPPQSEPTPLQ